MYSRVAALLSIIALSVTIHGCAGTSDQGSSVVTPPARPPAPAEAHYENMVDMIRGKVPGLEVIETSPGIFAFRIRGGVQSLQETMQEPLVIIDGMPQARRAGEVLMTLRPGDVASIDVLKDVSSTAVYGTRAANGVIVIKMVKRL
jgi:TonB-dependent SusC/RagA subfamily outer membrane receptor